MANLFSHYTAMHTLSPDQDLTGQVKRMDSYSFAYGGNSDGFKAKYLEREVSRAYDFYLITPSVCLSFHVQGGSQGLQIFSRSGQVQRIILSGPSNPSPNFICLFCLLFISIDLVEKSGCGPWSTIEILSNFWEYRTTSIDPTFTVLSLRIFTMEMPSTS